PAWSGPWFASPPTPLPPWSQPPPQLRQTASPTDRGSGPTGWPLPNRRPPRRSTPPHPHTSRVPTLHAPPRSAGLDPAGYRQPPALDAARGAPATLWRLDEGAPG